MASWSVFSEGHDQCAIGMVVGVEGVGSKTGFDAIDNDFSFNVLLILTSRTTSGRTFRRILPSRRSSS